MKYIIIDTETTHYDPSIAKAVEVAALVVDVASKEIIDSYSSLCNPGPEALAVAGPALEVSGISETEIQTAPPDHEIAGYLRDFIQSYGYPLLAYNAKYDATVLQKFPWQIPLDSWEFKYDIMMMAFQHMKRQNPCPLEWVEGFQDYKWPKLIEAARYYFGDVHSQRHRALDDALLEARLLFTLWDDVYGSV